MSYAEWSVHGDVMTSKPGSQVWCPASDQRPSRSFTLSCNDESSQSVEFGCNDRFRYAVSFVVRRHPSTWRRKPQLASNTLASTTPNPSRNSGVH